MYVHKYTFSYFEKIVKMPYVLFHYELNFFFLSINVTVDV